MKAGIVMLLAAMAVAISFQGHAQGTIIYDQQSALGPTPIIGNTSVDGLIIQTEPLTQSFIPTLSAIDFVQLEFEEVPSGGATVYVNLWEGSPNIHTVQAALVGSTAPVSLPSGFVNDGLAVGAVTNFYFSTPLTLTVGQTYYLQPVVSSGGNLNVASFTYDAYPNGQLYANGSPFESSIDLWFREGTTSVPEPSALALVGLAGLLILTRKLFRNFLLFNYPGRAQRSRNLLIGPSKTRRPGYRWGYCARLWPHNRAWR
jgi:hypothetical protein